MSTSNGSAAAGAGSAPPAGQWFAGATSTRVTRAQICFTVHRRQGMGYLLGDKRRSALGPVLAIMAGAPMRSRALLSSLRFRSGSLQWAWFIQGCPAPSRAAEGSARRRALVAYGGPVRCRPAPSQSPPTPFPEHADPPEAVPLPIAVAEIRGAARARPPLHSGWGRRPPPANGRARWSHFGGGPELWSDGGGRGRRPCCAPSPPGV